MNDQTLFIPEHIHIEFFDENGKPFRQSGILIGIKTNANHKNDINISPFLSDKNGHINITKTQILEKANDFISYGIMDYVSVEYSKPNVELHFWGNKSINIYLGYDIDDKLKINLETYTPDIDIESFKAQMVEQTKHRPDYLLFKQCFNRSTNIVENQILVQDIWNTPRKRVFYKIKIPV